MVHNVVIEPIHEEMMKIWFIENYSFGDSRNINGWDLCSGKRNGKAKLLYQQARLHDRCAAEMVLQTISASKGEAHITYLGRVDSSDFPGSPLFVLYWIYLVPEFHVYDGKR